jgi:hypothetical protein
MLRESFSIEESIQALRAEKSILNHPALLREQLWIRNAIE